MDASTKRRIVRDYIANLGGDAFQCLCDRLCSTLHPNDYTPVRAGGPKGDLKNDGFCPKARLFFAAHASRGEKITDIKKKIQIDLEGCLANHNTVKEWIYITNDTLVGEVHAFIDETLRPKHSGVTITTWDHNQITDKIAEMSDGEIEYILAMPLNDSKLVQSNTNAPGGIQIAAQGKVVNQYINATQAEERDYGILQEVIDFMLSQTGKPQQRPSRPKDLTKLRDKIDKNFTGDQSVTVDEVVLRTWGKRELVRHFVETQNQFDETRIESLILMLQSDFRRAKGNVANHHVAVEDYSIIEAIAKEYTPTAKRANPEYVANAVAVVLYFFELCNFGNK